MRVIITGGPGLLGSRLGNSLSEDGHDVIFLSRSPERTARDLRKGQRVERWDARSAEGWGHLADGADAIVNYAGEVIADPNPIRGRWTAARKRRILESRLNAGRAVVEAVKAAPQKPKVVVQASAVGYYGSRGEERLTESSPPGSDFMADVCVQWEASTAAAEQMGVRRVIIRTGLPLIPDGGFLPPLLLTTRLFVGGPLGRGRHYWPWIHMDDQVGAVRFLIESGASGPFNLSAPNPVTNAQFAKSLGKVLHRPAFIPTPPIALQLAFGELADGLLLSSQRQLPEALELMGYQFRFPELEPALRDTLGK